MCIQANGWCGGCQYGETDSKSETFSTQDGVGPRHQWYTSVTAMQMRRRREVKQKGRQYKSGRD